MVKKLIKYDRDTILMDGTPLDPKAFAKRMGGGPKGTRVIVNNLDTGEKYETHNMVLLDGGQWTAAYHWGLEEIVRLPSYNTDMALDTPGTVTAEGSQSIISLFCVGTGGCGLEASQVYPVDYTKRIQPANMIPFRYQTIDNDLNKNMREVYFGRKTVNNKYYAYYFKKPETTPTMYAQYVDGTPIDANVFTSQNSTEAEFYVETVLMITKYDCRDFFTSTTGINSAVMNQFSLCRAIKQEDNDGTIWYKDIHPVTQVNINAESLIDLEKGIEITYQTYY
jgi:hypothetical protein